MKDPQQLQNALKQMQSFGKFLARGEIKELAKILWEDEEPQDVVEGYYNRGTGLLVATDRRLIFIDKGLMSLKVEDFPYDKISSIQYSTGLLMGEIDIFTSGNKAEIKNVTKDRVRPFSEQVRNRISGGQKASNSENTINSSEDKYTKLEKLHALKEKGILSEKEYEEEKKENSQLISNSTLFKKRINFLI